MSQFSRVKFTGQDGASADFDVSSFSDDGVVYDVHLDYHTGTIKCSCPDAVYRRKDAPILSPGNYGCKHIRLVVQYLKLIGVIDE